MGFDPVSMAVGSTVLGLAGSAVGAEGQIEAGNAKAAEDRYQAAVAANNATIARQNAAWTSEAGAQKEFAQGMKTRAQIGNMKAVQGATGTDVNSGSNVGLRAGQAELGQLDALTIRSNTAREAYGYQVKAASETAQGELDTMEAQQAQAAGEEGALGSLLTGASSVAGKWGKFSLGSG